jgi:hypothetical protein
LREILDDIGCEVIKLRESTEVGERLPLSDREVRCIGVGSALGLLDWEPIQEEGELRRIHLPLRVQPRHGEEEGVEVLMLHEDAATDLVEEDPL